RKSQKQRTSDGHRRVAGSLLCAAGRVHGIALAGEGDASDWAAGRIGGPVLLGGGSVRDYGLRRPRASRRDCWISRRNRALDAAGVAARSSLWRPGIDVGGAPDLGDRRKDARPGDRWQRGSSRLAGKLWRERIPGAGCGSAAAAGASLDF